MAMPKEGGLDHTLEVLKEGYHYIMNHAEKFDHRIFETRILAEKVICMVGKEEAELFYDNEKFSRKNAAPGRIQKTLFGQGGVQGLDGQAHHHRKNMFMSLMTKEKLTEMQALVREEWRAEVKANQEKLEVYDAAKNVLTRAALKWTGVSVDSTDEEQWVDELSDMFEHAADVGPKHWKARYSRIKAQGWLEDMVDKVRNHELAADQDRALYQFSMHKDHNGKGLEKSIVAVEILNLLRPIVAIAVYIDFLMLSIHDFPEKVAHIEDGDAKSFIQEVRRYYPFFPFAAARVKQDFTWKGYEFKEGTLTLIDLYGTNHDPDIWENPERFEPERFMEWKSSPFDFIPQGGGEFDIGHRCAGEWMTIDILKETAEFFVNEVSYSFPKQNLAYSMNDIPSLPKSRVVITFE
ncbi:cytochrome P450 [Gracilibacillus salinarum]|uniref:Cytochrome P450 n=1 Tax=Gracilibacillus salinarum TaxID=2932255 RepID=A0ABY4GL32_9BACI|nr:cytochrome P450 [Gracilibacillus salinarum]UOQ84914.1 cytochrome P450 [Gracilibacillus salinarum]